VGVTVQCVCIDCMYVYGVIIQSLVCVRRVSADSLGTI
jgi:hypothetical protein